MRALIMAGGAGTRLKLGEKPLVTINGIPMISLVLSAFEKSGYHSVIVTSPRTPFTMNWARANGIECIRGAGLGYIGDLQEAVKSIEETGPFFTCVADLPCLSPNHIIEIRAAYVSSGKEALSTWVPIPCPTDVVDMPYAECICGVDACPAGINILMDRHLAYNINTRTDLERIRRFFSRSPLPKEENSGVLPG